MQKGEHSPQKEFWRKQKKTTHYGVSEEKNKNREQLVLFQYHEYAFVDLESNDPAATL